MDSLKDLLASRNPPTQPEEPARIKKYVMETYGQEVSVSLGKKQITIIAPSAALAATIHMEKEQLVTNCSLTLQLRIRVG